MVSETIKIEEAAVEDQSAGKKFMDALTLSICPRCGKQRVVIKTYKEVVGTSSVSYTETACPDKKCQEVVDEKLLEEEQRRLKYVKAPTSKENPRNKKKAN